MSEFEKGDRVKILAGLNKGMIGTVRCTDRGYIYPYGIVLDEPAKCSFGDSGDWAKKGYSDIADARDIKKISEFKVGDKIRQIKGGYATSSDDNGREAYVKAVRIDTLKIERIGVWKADYEWVGKGGFVKIGGSMNKYDDLKQRIEASGNGWDKDFDNLLQEIKSHSDNVYYEISIGVRNEGGEQSISILSGSNKILQATWCFTSQCEKMTCLKRAALWLLERSNAKKDNTEEIAALKKEMEVLQEKIDKL